MAFTPKIIRSICLFSQDPSEHDLPQLSRIAKLLEEKGYVIQTKRLCSGRKNISSVRSFDDGQLLLSIGSLTYDELTAQLNDWYDTKNISLNVDLTHETIDAKYINLLLSIIKNKPSHTFNFTYVFNNAHSSPFFPSAAYHTNGFSIGLQPTDLAANCISVEEWLGKQKEVWQEIYDLFASDPHFIGIDSSIAPLFEGQSSFVYFIKQLGMSFPESTTTDTYVKMTKFIKEENPKPVGLCGLMFPCLEDFALAEEYERGEFSIERNIYLSLHSGLGIDTYPIGADESPKKVIQILRLIQALSNKYKKPLAVRFVSDGIAKIGEKTNFQNQYLKDIVVKAL